MKTGVKADLSVKTRIEALYYFIYEMSDAFGVNLSGLETIRKGVFEKQLVRKIIVNYYNEKDEVVGRVTIDIDWEKHEFLASTDYGSTFRLDPKKAVKSQISELSEIIISHVNKMRKTYHVKKVVTRFRYIEQIESDPEKNRETMKYLGHVYGENDIEKIEPIFNQTLSWVIDQLSEVSITVANK